MTQGGDAAEQIVRISLEGMEVAVKISGESAKPAAYIVVEKYLGFSYVPMANAMKEKYSCIRHIFVDSESGDISGMIAETCGENGAFPAVDGYQRYYIF